jgi:hypothetical protein
MSEIGRAYWNEKLSNPLSFQRGWKFGYDQKLESESPLKLEIIEAKTRD